MELLKPSIRPKDSNLAMISTYSPVSQSVKQVINKHWHILESDPKVGTEFQIRPSYFYKRSTNLRNSLVKTDFPSTNTHFMSRIPSGNFPCHNCIQCYSMTKGSTFIHPKTGKEYKVRGRVSCKTDYVVYALTCPCKLWYIGKTKRELKVRICEHKCAIRNQDEKSSVARHFNSANHSISDLRFFGIEVVKMPKRGGDRDRLLLQRECYYIHLFDSMMPNGLNEENIFTCFL